MSAPRRKYYVVWVGNAPGIYDSWEECKLQTANYPGARFKSYDTLEAATAAYRGDPREEIEMIRTIARHAKSSHVDYHSIPGIRFPAICVDAGCRRNPGPMDYRGVDLETGETLFHVGPLPGGTNNIGEYLAIVHALAMLDQRGDHTTAIYSDSRNAQAWIRRRHSATKVTPNAHNAQVLAILARADRWVATHPILNPILKWDTEHWGEIPADFGRKG